MTNLEIIAELVAAINLLDYGDDRGRCNECEGYNPEGKRNPERFGHAPNCPIGRALTNAAGAK